MKRRTNSSISAAEDRIENPSFSKVEETRTLNSPFFSSSKRVFISCLTFRIVNSLLVQTYFNPDEHWQALEVAHRIAFGYGHLTWEWKKGIRSYLHPMLFAFLYKVLSLLGLDSPWFMMRAPRLLQSIFSALGDLYLYRYSGVIFGEHVAKWALFSQLTNWFMFFCYTRTLSNSLETVLTLVGLYYWPCLRVPSVKATETSRKWGLAIAGFACAIRPTSAIMWLYVGLLELFKARDRLKFLFLEVAPIGVLVLASTSLFDSLMCGSLTLVPLNFLKFNFLSSGGDYYGTHKWHWYFTQGFPVMLLSFLPFSIAGVCLSKEWKLAGLIVWVLGLYSMLGHKEFRFVLPVLPIALMLSGYSLAAMQNPDSLNVRRKGPLNKSHNKCPSRLRLAIFFLLVTNIPMALYMSLVHQMVKFSERTLVLIIYWLKMVFVFLVSFGRLLPSKCARQRGSEDVMNFLSKEALSGRVKSITFLMPCHATPYYSILHHNLPMRFLDCTPSDDKGVLDESDRFMMDPVGFTSDMAKDWSLPSHIVLFDAQERLLKEFLISHSFREIRRFFHAHFKVDRDLQASVVVYAFTGQ